ncbi:hypothetical protein SAY87_011959 [Trapa incisa]|uniref:Uncharacterized protein n=1 Tax=Trapa incisa TaxID=236973 RepID=A0AAN7H0B5_9MYRT|nr:hypothetical protein SAY87_011959 [Trapa incisa]
MSIRSNSGCSARQESGWTLYLDESSASAARTKRKSGFLGGVVEGQVEDEEEENLSMVSDASSGPPHYKPEDFNESEFYSSFTASSCAYSKTRAEEKKKQKEKCAKGNNGGRGRSTASSLPWKSEYSNYSDDSRNNTAESSATRKTGLLSST